jgi:hypothetical protein
MLGSNPDDPGLDLTEISFGISVLALDTNRGGVECRRLVCPLPFRKSATVMEGRLQRC